MTNQKSFAGFTGDALPGRVSLFSGNGRQTLPFPHPWNYDQPITILEAYFHGSDKEDGSARHCRCLKVPGLAPVLVTRDPVMIRDITVETGDGEGKFDRDTLPSTGIARATGKDTLLFANGAIWKRQRKAAASPFGKTALFKPEVFAEFEESFRKTVMKRLELLQQRLVESQQESMEVWLEPEIKAVMLELLSNKFFGADIPYDELRDRYVPSLDRVIAHIVRDTVTNKLGIPITRWPSLTPGIRQLKADYKNFDELTSRVLAQRAKGTGLWKHFKSDAPDEALRANLKVFLAGALEATTSYASWAISHLARNPTWQEAVAKDVAHLEVYTPEALESASSLSAVLDETLRLTPSLYFLPRRATVDTKVETKSGKTMTIPKGTHILLDIWHANRHEDFWGVEATGYPADVFEPARWEEMSKRGRSSKETLHFGFGHGPRVCPGKHLGQMEVALVVGAVVKMFRFEAIHPDPGLRAGVSTKPNDNVAVRLRWREA